MNVHVLMMKIMYLINMLNNKSIFTISGSRERSELHESGLQKHSGEL